MKKKKEEKKKGKQDPHAKPSHFGTELDWSRRSTAAADQKIKFRPGFPPQYLTLPQPHQYFTFTFLFLFCKKLRGAPRLLLPAGCLDLSFSSSTELLTGSRPGALSLALGALLGEIEPRRSSPYGCMDGAPAVSSTLRFLFREGLRHLPPPRGIWGVRPRSRGVG